MYEDNWFRIATAVYAQIKRLFAEDAKASELIEAAKRRLFGLRLEVVEAPLLKIEAAVDRDGKIAAVRWKAALDLSVDVVFTGVAPGYRLEKTAQAGGTAGAGGGSAEKVATDTAGGVGRRDGGGAALSLRAAGWSVFWRG